VGVTSVAAVRGRMDRPGYNASKAAQDAHLEALRNRTVAARRCSSPRCGSGPVGHADDRGPEDADGDQRGSSAARSCILRARDRRRAIAYVPWQWWPIMTVIACDPVVPVPSSMKV
jgi:decaprenylphospho-beta-D-erythro-pentofuranosid-2-ulose 2-reductase